jgi:HK97 family phage portal protein
MADTKNQLQKFLYEFQLANGLNLINFDNLERIIETGFNSNPDVYSIIAYLSNFYTSIPKKPYRKLSNGSLEEITDPKIVSIVNKVNATETLKQFERLRYTFYLVTGNSFVYAPRYIVGNNKGQLTELGRIVMPSQYTEIISGGWREPIKGYIINYNFTSENIPVEEVIHIKMINLKYINGDNFYGMSPLRTAALIIQSQNGGYEAMASTLKRGFPSGILTSEDEQDNSGDEALERANILKKIWRRFYGKAKNSGEPIITAGKKQWIEMGFKNFKELQIIESSQHGLRVLCNIYQCPSQILNDIQGTTFNNQKEVRKAVYNNRTIPDCDTFDEVDNINVWSNYGFYVYSDYSGIPELQSDKKETADMLNVAQNAGALLTAGEIRRALDIDVPSDPLMDEIFSTLGKQPISQIMEPNIDATLKQLGISHYIK